MARSKGDGEPDHLRLQSSSAGQHAGGQPKKARRMPPEPSEPSATGGRESRNGRVSEETRRRNGGNYCVHETLRVGKSESGQ